MLISFDRVDYQYNYLYYSSEEKRKWNNKYWNQKTFLLMTYMEKMSNFTVVPPGQTIAYKNIDNLFKNDMYVS